MWVSYKNTVSDALGLFFQIKLFKSLHLLGLLVLSKPGTQGEAGGVLPTRSPRAEHSACTLRMEGKGPPPQGSPWHKRSSRRGSFPSAALACGCSGPGASLCPCVSRCPESAKVPAAPDGWLSSHL